MLKNDVHLRCVTQKRPEATQLNSSIAETDPTQTTQLHLIRLMILESVRSVSFAETYY